MRTWTRTWTCTQDLNPKPVTPCPKRNLLLLLLLARAIYDIHAAWPSPSSSPATVRGTFGGISRASIAVSTNLFCVCIRYLRTGIFNWLSHLCLLSLSSIYFSSLGYLLASHWHSLMVYAYPIYFLHLFQHLLGSLWGPTSSATMSEKLPIISTNKRHYVVSLSLSPSPSQSPLWDLCTLPVLRSILLSLSLQPSV